MITSDHPILWQWRLGIVILQHLLNLITLDKLLSGSKVEDIEYIGQVSPHLLRAVSYNHQEFISYDVNRSELNDPETDLSAPTNEDVV